MLNYPRIRRLVDQAIETFKLDLGGAKILTEAGSNLYTLTPIIAALAGAQQVLALTRDTRYGTAAEVRGATLRLAERFGVIGTIEVVTSREHPKISDADIVTNLGMVRPLDAAMLNRLKRTAVIPLMWETWEFRPEDLDLPVATRLGIPVLGTNEHHPALDIFPYVGHLALKLLFEAGIEVHRSVILVAGHGEFAELARRSLEQAGAETLFADTAHPGSMRAEGFRSRFPSADALVVVDHHHRRCLIGPEGEITPSELVGLNPGLVIAHISGGVEAESLAGAGITLRPDRIAPAGYMSVATDYMGPRPLIDLHTAGLKVGEAMWRARQSGRNAREIMSELPLEFPLAMGFAG